MTVLAATRWQTNGHLIEDVAKLGYLDGHVLDPTYGKGNWWKLWEPKLLTKHDLALGTGVDFRDLPYSDETFDAVAFDPPYVSKGGRETSTIDGMDEAYGMADTPPTPRALFRYNRAGFWECARVLKPGGHLLYKSKDYITGGKLQPVTHWILVDVLEVGVYLDCRLDLIDRFEHIGNPGPQPKTNLDGSPRRQVHAARNLSTLLVFKKR